jgi:hypothetical protein
LARPAAIDQQMPAHIQAFQVHRRSLVAAEKNGRLARRDLLKAAAGLTAAGALVAVPALVLRPEDRQMPAAPDSAMTHALEGNEAPIVAFVQDAARGEVVLMLGTEQVVIQDAQLVARLHGAMRG